jgi:hypothetical protein
MEFQKLLLLFLSITLSTAAHSQQIEVLLTYGNAEYIAPGQINWQSVKLPFSASKGDFRLADGSIVLYKVTGTEKTVQLKKTGTYSIAALIAHANADRGTLARAISTQLVKKTDVKTKSKGSVIRGDLSDRMPIDSSIAVAGNAITFSNNLPEVKSFRFRITNDEGEVLIDTLGSKSMFQYTFHNPGSFYWRIDEKGNETDQNISSIIVEDVANFMPRVGLFLDLIVELIDTPEEWRSQILELYYLRNSRLVFE